MDRQQEFERSTKDSKGNGNLAAIESRVFAKYLRETPHYLQSQMASMQHMKNAIQYDKTEEQKKEDEWKHKKPQKWRSDQWQSATSTT